MSSALPVDIRRSCRASNNSWEHRAHVIYHAHRARHDRSRLGARIHASVIRAGTWNHHQITVNAKWKKLLKKSGIVAISVQIVGMSYSAQFENARASGSDAVHFHRPRQQPVWPDDFKRMLSFLGFVSLRGRPAIQKASELDQIPIDFHHKGGE